MIAWRRIVAVAVFLLAPLHAFAVPVQVVQAPAGMELWLSEEHTLPIIAVSIAIPAGSAFDPSGKEGLASMTAALLDEGAGDMDSQAFHKALEARAIRLSAGAGSDYLEISLVTLTEHADEAFRLLALALQHPRFDQDAVARIQVQMLAGLKQDEEDPETIASKAFFKTYYGTHPYGHPSTGSLESVGAITVGDIKNFAATHLTRAGAKIAVAGDIAPAKLQAYLQQVFAPLPDGSEPSVAKPDKAAAPGTAIIAMDVPQPTAVFGVPGPLRLDPDFIPTYVANYIFGGGGFSSRLMEAVRVKRGLTYGISTGVMDMRSSALVIGSVGSRKTQITTALDVLRSEMANFAKNGVTKEELNDAKTYLTGAFPLAFDSTVKIAGQLNAFQQDGLAPDYVEKRNALIEAVTLDQVNAMAKKYFDPAKLTVVIAGTPGTPSADEQTSNGAAPEPDYGPTDAAP